MVNWCNSLLWWHSLSFLLRIHINVVVQWHSEKNTSNDLTRFFLSFFSLIFSNKNGRARIKKLVKMLMEIFLKIKLWQKYYVFYDITFGVILSTVSGEQTSKHGLRTPREEIAFTARPKIHSHSQIFRYGRSIFCLPHRPNFSDIFYLCLHWVSVVRASKHAVSLSICTWFFQFSSLKYPAVLNWIFHL